MADPRAFNRKQLREWAESHHGGHKFAAMGVLLLLEQIETSELMEVRKLLESIDERLANLESRVVEPSVVINQLAEKIAASKNKLSDTIHAIDTGGNDGSPTIEEQTVEGDDMDPALQNLSDQVTALTTVTDSAVTLLNGLAAQLAAAKTDPAKVQAIADSIKANADKLAKAITDNTPATP